MRQYIGARYTPGFFMGNINSEWEPNTIYEPLIIVYYNNSTYISKQTVPSSIGNPADNPTYWLLTGNYNGQIANIQNDLTSIHTNFSNNKLRKIAVIGDSYCINDGSYYSGWGDLVRNYLSDLGITSYVHGSGGASFVSSNSYLNQLKQSPFQDFTDIYIFGGLNDFYSSDQSSITAAMVTLANTYPKAKIYYGFIGKDKTKYTELYNYLFTVENNCRLSKINFVKNAYLWYHNNNDLLTDGAHFNSDANQKAGYSILAYILNDQSIFTGSSNKFLNVSEYYSINDVVYFEDYVESSMGNVVAFSGTLSPYIMQAVEPLIFPVLLTNAGKANIGIGKMNKGTTNNIEVYGNFPTAMTGSIALSFSLNLNGFMF